MSSAGGESSPALLARPGEQVLVLARHGRTALNAQGRILGRRDPPLDEVGLAQAHALADLVRGSALAAVWTSPLQRAFHTAQVAAAALGLEPRVLRDLAESDRGSWEGRTQAAIAEETPEAFAAFRAADPGFAFPGGESLREQVGRTCRALAVVADGPLPALVVAHVGTMRATLIALGRPVPPEAEVPHGEPLQVPAAACGPLPAEWRG